MMHIPQLLQQFTATALCALLAGPLSWAQNQRLEPVRPSTPVLRTYQAVTVPPVKLTNSPRLRDLIRAGKLYLTAQDAIALALENNLDLESYRYNPLTAVWSEKRAEAGGALPGVPSGSSQVNTVVSGAGVAGTQAAAGVNNGTGGGTGAATNTTITQVGPVAPTLDPVFQSSGVFSHLSNPQSNLSQTETENWIRSQRTFIETYNQGLITGGTVSLSFTDQYVKENVPSDLLNPINAVRMQLQVRHNFLNGFGRAMNARNITIGKANIHISDLTFKTQVIGVVANVLNLYYGLVADLQDVKAKQSALDVAQRFYEDNKKQVQIGTMAPLDVTTAEAQAATAQQDLVISQTTLQQQQVSLKNVLSRNGLGDPLLRDVEIVPLDRIDVPEKDDTPPMKQLIATAMANRVDLEVDRLNLVNSETSSLGTKSGILPTLNGIVNVSTQGLSGTAQLVPVSRNRISQAYNPDGTLRPGYLQCPVSPIGACQVPPQFFVGGLGTAVSQAFRRNFPTQSAGGFIAGNMRNRQAQADYGIDQLSLRQTELQDARSVNQVAVNVSNQSVALQQARARYQAAVHNRVLQQQLLDAEQKRFALGASTSFLVVQQQRDLATAQSTEVAALVAYSNARIALDQTLGTTLQANNVTIEEAQSGEVHRQSVLPPTLP